MCMHHFDREAMAGDLGVHLGDERLKFKSLLIICQNREMDCAFQHFRDMLQLLVNQLLCGGLRVHITCSPIL